MSKNWEYSLMTEAAAAAGGPNKWIRGIRNDGYREGSADTRKEDLMIGIGAYLVCKLLAPYLHTAKEYIVEKFQGVFQDN